jgi:hypothetical protein
MAQSDKAVVISFRADPHLAELLNNLPDRSGFIRRAILNRFHQACPACKGRGVVPEGVAKWLADKLARAHTVACTCCAYEFPETLTPTSESEQFLCDHCQGHDHEHW